MKLVEKIELLENFTSGHFVQSSLLHKYWKDSADQVAIS